MFGGKSASIPAVGSRASVWHGNAVHTSGGLTKSDLKMNKHGRIVSLKASRRGHLALRKNLIPRGYVAKKGVMLLGKKMLRNGSSPKRSTSSTKKRASTKKMTNKRKSSKKGGEKRKLLKK